jgi:hypothetical protein
MADFEKPLTRLPTYVDKPDPFLSIGEIKMSLKQMLTLVFGMITWFAACSVTAWIIGFAVAVPTPLMWVMFSWIIAGTFVLVWRRKDLNGNGIRIGYEEYLTKKLMFSASPSHYIVKDTKTSAGTIEDADWSSADDEFAGWNAR